MRTAPNGRATGFPGSAGAAPRPPAAVPTRGRSRGCRVHLTALCAAAPHALGGAGCGPVFRVQDNGAVKVTSPHDGPVAHGGLRIEGRFGCQHVQNRG